MSHNLDDWTDSEQFWLDLEDEWAADYNERRGTPHYARPDRWLMSGAECLRMAQRARWYVENARYWQERLAR